MQTPSKRVDSAAQHAAAKVFISYSRKDITFVRRLFEALETHQLGHGSIRKAFHPPLNGGAKSKERFERAS
jgi:hypothetical protein